MVDLAIINEFPYIVRCAAQKIAMQFYMDQSFR